MRVVFSLEVHRKGMVGVADLTGMGMANIDFSPKFAQLMIDVLVRLVSLVYPWASYS